jgi:NAD(P)-dependent dehydrogenase (short-subunit alcohol dehydrogenase family)
MILAGAIRATQAFLPLLRESTGRVVFISSLAGVAAQKVLFCQFSFAWCLDAWLQASAPDWKLATI